MVQYIRYVGISLILFGIGYFSYRTYLYYFDTTSPEAMVVGLTDDKYYAGQITGMLKGSSSYKVSHLSMWLDDTLMHQDVKINKKQFDYPISLDTQNVVDGKHTIKFEIVDGTKSHNKKNCRKNIWC